MGFWQGLNEGLDVVREEKARKKELETRQQEIETERDIRRQEREQDWTRQKEMLSLQQRASWQEALYAEYAKREQSRAAAGALRDKADLFLSKLGDIKDPRVDDLRSNPAVAAQLEDTYQAILIEQNKAGIDTVPLEGQALLDAFTVQGDGGQVIPVDISIEDIATISSQEDYFKTLFELSQPTTPTITASFKPEVYFRPDPTVLKEGRAMFDDLVLQQANAYRDSIAGDANEAAKIDDMLKGYATEGSVERANLRARFGAAAAETLLASGDNPYLTGLQKDAQLAPFIKEAEVNKLKAGIEDPTLPPELRQKAVNILRDVYGIDYMGVNVNGR